MPITKSKAERKFSVTMNDTRKKERKYFNDIDAIHRSQLYGSFWKKPKPIQTEARFTSAGFVD